MSRIKVFSHESESASTTLLFRVRNSDAEAWQRFTSLYSPWIYAIARRAGLGENDAADISQEVFMTAAIRIDSFRRDQPGQSMRLWLAQITRNKIGDWFRTHSKLPKVTGVNDAQLENWYNHQDDESSVAEDRTLVQRAIDIIRSDFNETTWRCFYAMVVENRSAPDIADEFSMAPKAVRQAKYRVLRRLREEFDGLIDI